VALIYYVVRVKADTGKSYHLASPILFIPPPKLLLQFSVPLYITRTASYSKTPEVIVTLKLYIV